MKLSRHVVSKLLVVGIFTSSLFIVSVHQRHLKHDLQETPTQLSGFLQIASPPASVSQSSQRNPLQLVVTGTSNSIVGAIDVDEGTVNRSECFPLNSQSWLTSKRLGNQNDTFIDDEFVLTTIMATSSLLVESPRHDRTQKLLQQTLCEQSSRLLASNHHEVSQNPTNDTIHFLSIRLMYLAIHVHQHTYAVEEAAFRLKQKSSAKCSQEMNSRQIGKFDFECPKAKFLVVSLKQRGLGAIIRLNAAPAFLAGLASDRVVLFVNNSPVGPKFLREPWMLTSCPRKDKQCFFLPDSPCVLTIGDLQNATQLGKGEKRALFKSGQLPNHIEEARVVLMDMTTRPQRLPATIQSKIANIVQNDLIRPLVESNQHDPRLPLLTLAAAYIREGDESFGESFYYYGRNSRALHAVTFFAMRPRYDYVQRVNDILQRVFGGVQRETDFSLGLPIRASDKCIDESECLPFEQYMLVMQTVWDKHEDKLMAARRQAGASKDVDDKAVKASIILTSESSEVHRAQTYFESRAMNKNLTFPFRFIKNKFDVHQTTGNPYEMESVDKENVFLSSIVALKMQFQARYTVGNCCSNFHLLLFDFLNDGCGAAQDHIAECLQDHEDPSFRVCCGWTRTIECQAKRENRTLLAPRKRKE